jgi:hypothetical protein
MSKDAVVIFFSINPKSIGDPPCRRVFRRSIGKIARLYLLINSASFKTVRQFRIVLTVFSFESK